MRLRMHKANQFIPYLFLIICLCSTSAQGQFSQNAKIENTKKQERLVLPKQNNRNLVANELARRRKGSIPEFAKDIDVDVTPQKSGIWSIQSEVAIWKYVIKSPKATSLNLGFTEFDLPPSSKLYISSGSTGDVLGPLQSSDNEDHGQYWSPVLKGDEIELKLEIAPADIDHLKLRLSKVNHGFLDLYDSYINASGSCHVDPICGTADGHPEIENYRDQIRAVGHIVLNGKRNCTGFLVNSTRNDCHPYFMTANHCGINANNASSVVVYWNYNNSFCRPVGSSASGGDGDGVLSNSNSGARLLANWSVSDFTLLELDDIVHPSANAFFAGWDRSNSSPSSTATIHHPNTEEKRISFDNEAPATTYSYTNKEVADGTHFRILDWDKGSTEPGSSGAPLFDQDGRIVGQLHGGYASCSNNLSDWYGRIFASWEGGRGTGNSLKPHLDPEGLNYLTIDGIDANACGVELDPIDRSLSICDENVVRYKYLFSNLNTSSLNVSQSGLPAPVTTHYQIKSGTPDTLEIIFHNIFAIPIGEYVIALNINDGISTYDDNLVLGLSRSLPSKPSAILPQDMERNAPTRPVFSWSTVSQSSYEIQISDNLNFTNILYVKSDIENEQWELDIELTPLQEYFWRVRAVNDCGPSDWSTTFNFRTALKECFTRNALDLSKAIELGELASTTSTITILSGGAISNISVPLIKGTHTWVQDLVFTLTSPSGTTALLMANKCFDEDNFELGFDDAALTSEISCPIDNGTLYIPETSFSIFNGEPAVGNWILEVTDAQALDGGSLDQWQLEVCSNLLPSAALTIDHDTIGTCTSVDTTVNLQINSAFEDSVFISAIELPEGIDAEISQNIVAPGQGTSIRFFGTTTSGLKTILIKAENDYMAIAQPVVLEISNIPDIPVPVSPLDAEIDLDLEVAFEWNNVINADRYELIIAEDASFNSIVDQISTADLNAVTDLDQKTKYFWKIEAHNLCGKQSSQVRTFTTLELPPIYAIDTMILACQNQVLIQYVVSADLGESLDLQLSGIPPNVNINIDKDPIGPGDTVNITLDNLMQSSFGIYTVMATFTGATESHDVPINIEINESPDAIFLSTPLNGSMDIRMGENYTWSPTPNIEEYVFEISKNIGFTDIVVSQFGLTDASYALDVTLEPNTNFWWRVTGSNKCGQSSSPSFSFVSELTTTILTASEYELRIFPNPTLNMLVIQADENVILDHLQIVDLTGKIVRREEINSSSIQINMQELSAGVYTLLIFDKDQIIQHRISKL